MNRRNSWPEAAGEVQPVNAFLEKRVAAGHGLVVAPVISRLEPVRDGREVREHHLADDALFDQPAQADGERLVVIVLADDHRSSGSVAGRDDRSRSLSSSRKAGFSTSTCLPAASACSVSAR